MNKILIVDDDRDICTLLRKCFTKKGYQAFVAGSGNEAIKWLKANNVNLVICDFKLPDYTGIDILQKIKIIDARIQVIIITGYSDVRVAVEALKKGAFDYVTKPLYPDEILMTVQNALESQKEKESPQNAAGSTKVKPLTTQEFVRGVSRQSQLVQKHIDLIAPTDMSVIISGETGTGKEYVAKAIHEKSKRAGRPFVALDCGAIPRDLAASELFGHVKGAFTGAINDKKGCFELANSGTLFLDEIGNLDYENQVKFLRVLQETVVKKVGGTDDIPVDVRVLVATNENLSETVEAGDFREDIYHRLNEFKIDIAPLRERPEDIELFANHFLKLANEQLNKQVMGFGDGVMEKLKSYHWHGNLRELRNVIKRAVLLCRENVIRKECLPPEIADVVPLTTTHIVDNLINGSNRTLSLKAIAEQAERQAILRVLKQTNNNKTKTAELLKVDRKTLYNKLKQK